MNNRYRIYWLWVILSVPLYYMGAMLFKHEMKGIGEWFFLFSSCSIVYGIAGSLAGGQSWDRNQTTDNSGVTNVVNNYYYYHDNPSITEGTEIVSTSADGSSTTTRHIRKWN